MDLNKAMIIGRLTRDPEVRTTPQGTSVANFSVATNFVWMDQQGQKQEKVEFHDIVVWRKLADICGQYLKKGSKVYLEGRLQTRDWEGEDGVKRYRTENIADNMNMLDRAGSGQGQNSNQNFSRQNKTENEVPTVQVDEDTALPGGNDQKSDNNSGSDEEIKIENIPF